MSVTPDPMLEQTVAADPVSVSGLRTQLATWLGRYLRIDAERHADIVLAAYEALSNCADHAYLGQVSPGAVTMQLGYDRAEEVLSLCVVDSGVWVDPTTHRAMARGRGIALMRALADDVTVDGRSDGTSVCLKFRHCPSPEPV